MSTNPFIRKAVVEFEPLQRDFDEFHAANPHVYDELVWLARQGKAAGAKKLGIGQLFEVLRWQTLLRTNSTDFKLNNNLRSFYARMIMERESDLAGIFETRTSVADRKKH